MSHMKNKSIIKNYIYNLVYEIVALIVPLITTPYVSRILGADGIGIYSYTLSIITYFILFGKIGFQTYGQLQAAELRDDKYKLSKMFWEIAIARILTMTVSLFFFSIVIIIDKKNSIYYLLLLTLYAANYLDFTWFLQGIEEFKKTVLRNIFVKIITLILIFVLVKNKSDLYLYFIIVQGSVLFGNILLIPFLKKYIIPIKTKDLQILKHIKKSLPYFIPTIATTIYLSIDKSMIGWFTKSSFENGYYEQAHKIEQVAVTLLTSLSIVVMPRMAYYFKNKKFDKINTVFGEAIEFIMFLSIPMACGLIGISSILVPWFLGPGFNKSVLLLQIFSILIIVVGLNNAVGKQILIPMKRQKEYNISVILGAIINIIANAILINKYMAYGAAVASVLAETIILLLFCYYSKDIIHYKDFIKKTYKFFISGLTIMLGLIFVNNYFNIVGSFITISIEIMTSIIVYILILFILKEDFLIKWKDKVKLIIRNYKKKENEVL